MKKAKIAVIPSEFLYLSTSGYLLSILSANKVKKLIHSKTNLQTNTSSISKKQRIALINLFSMKALTGLPSFLNDQLNCAKIISLLLLDNYNDLNMSKKGICNRPGDYIKKREITNKTWRIPPGFYIYISVESVTS